VTFFGLAGLCVALQLFLDSRWRRTRLTGDAEQGQSSA
jgi:hypothetical protein